MMQVSGRRSDLITGSDSYSGPECQPCRTSGQIVEVEGFCQTCREHLCRQCYREHKKHLPCRNHVLLDKSMMPMNTPSASTKPRTCLVPCSDHPDEMVKFYCTKHNNVACYVCSQLYHKTCQVKYLTKYKGVYTYKDSGEYKELVSELNQLDEEATYFVNNIRTVRTSLPKNEKALVECIQQSTEEAVDYIYEREKDLIKLAKTKSKDDQIRYEKSEKECVAMKADIEQRKNQFETLQNDEIDGFVSTKQLLQKIPTYRQSVTEYKAMNKAPQYRFIGDEKCKQFMESEGTLGVIERYRKQVDPGTAKTSKLPDIKVISTSNYIKAEFSKETVRPWITGMALLPPHTILAVDTKNCSLKAIDTTTNTITSQVRFSNRPWDVALLPDNRAAVTIPYEKRLQLLSTKGKLTLTKSIPVSGYCFGVAATQEHIVVSYVSPGKVEIMDIHRNLIKDSNGEEMFEWPVYITATQEKRGQVIYVSDGGIRTITKLSTKGDVLGIYRNDDWKCIRGITRAFGRLLVCDLDRNTVSVVSDVGDDVTTLLDQANDGIVRPQAVCYCPPQGRLCVSSGSSGTPIIAYQLS